VKRSAAAFALGVALSATSYAWADDPSAADVASARQLAQDGTKLANAGHCAEAIDKLARAERLYHAPSTLERLGFCQAKLGKVVEASENLLRVTRESLPANAPKAFVKAQERAAKLLPATRARIAKLKIDVTAPPNTAIAVTIDGESLPSANIGTDRHVDPGEHNVEATAPGMIAAKTRATLRDGESISVTLALEPDPNAPKTTPVATPSTTTPSTTPAKTSPADPRTPAGHDDEEPSRLPAYLALGVGVVGIGVGSVFGLLATGKKGDLDAACSGEKRCPETQESTLDSAKSLATVSTTGPLVVAVGLLAGGVLCFTSAPSKRGARSATPYVGAGSIGIAGSF